MSAGEIAILGGALVLTGLMAWYFFGPRRSRQADLGDGVQIVRVIVKGGYSPDVIQVAPGVPVRMMFDRQESGDCSSRTDVLAVLAGHDCNDVDARLRVRPEEPAEWVHLSRRLAVPMHGDGVISQFDGYEALAELDWTRYRATYGNIGRLDLILEAEGDSTNRYKLAKQADVLMLVYLLGPDGLLETLDRLGYPTTPDALTRTVDYYLARTADGSTLSRVVHASVLARRDPTRAWRIFRDALAADLDDTQVGRRARASTSVPWPAPSTWSPAHSRGCVPRTTPSPSTPNCPMDCDTRGSRSRTAANASTCPSTTNRSG